MASVTSEIRGKRLGLPRSVVLYNRNALPCILYPAQLFEPDKPILALEAHYTQRITAAPYRSVSAGILWNLKRIGFSFQLRDLSNTARASRTRIAYTSSSYLRCVTKYRETLESYESILSANSYFWRAMWYDYSALASVTKAYDLSFQLCRSLKCGKDFQKRIFEKLKKEEEGNPGVEDVQTSLTRWSLIPDITTVALGNRVCKVGTRTRAWGACSYFLKVLCHGICTNRRFHGDHPHCRFGCLDAQDDVLHFFKCPILAKAVKECCRRPRWAHIDATEGDGLDLKMLTFALPSCSVEHDCIIILLVDAIVSSHNKLRSYGGSGEEVTRDYLHSRITSWSRTSSYILKIINGG